MGEIAEYASSDIQPIYVNVPVVNFLLEMMFQVIEYKKNYLISFAENAIMRSCHSVVSTGRYDAKFLLEISAKHLTEFITCSIEHDRLFGHSEFNTPLARLFFNSVNNYSILKLVIEAIKVYRQSNNNNRDICKSNVESVIEFVNNLAQQSGDVEGFSDSILADYLLSTIGDVSKTLDNYANDLRNNDFSVESIYCKLIWAIVPICSQPPKIRTTILTKACDLILWLTLKGISEHNIDCSDQAIDAIAQINSKMQVREIKDVKIRASILLYGWSLCHYFYKTGNKVKSINLLRRLYAGDMRVRRLHIKMKKPLQKDSVMWPKSEIRAKKELLIRRLTEHRQRHHLDGESGYGILKELIYPDSFI